VADTARADGRGKVGYPLIPYELHPIHYIAVGFVTCGLLFTLYVIACAVHLNRHPGMDAEITVLEEEHEEETDTYARPPLPSGGIVSSAPSIH